MSRELEEGLVEMLDFTKLAKVAATGRDVLPVAVQHADTGEMLTLAYVNKVALERSLKDRVAVFWSTSRNELWIKGATSGDYLDLVDIRVNCEQNALLYLVRPRCGGVCHTKGENGTTRRTCFYRSVGNGSSLQWIDGLK